MSFAGCKLLALLILIPAAVNAEADAEWNFMEGTRLADAGLLYIARQHYLEASRLGMDTPALNYSLGVIHYRTGYLDEARDALLRVTGEPEFEARAYYHLGLVSHEQRSPEEALKWLHLAGETADDSGLAALVFDARERLLAEYRGQTETEEPWLPRLGPDDPAASYWSIDASLGYGYDGNIYRTPNGPYNDLTQPGSPLTEPVTQSWAFAPVEISARFSVNTFEGERFFTQYEFQGRYYLDQDLTNANRKRHRLQIGSHYRKASEHGEREARGIFELSHYRRKDLDPVDGTSREFQDVSLADRYQSWSVGPTLILAEQRGRLRYGLDLVGQIWDYDDFPVVPDYDRLDRDYEGEELVPQYDHEYFAGRLHADYLAGSSTVLGAEARYYTRRYSERRSQDRDGQLPVTSPSLEHRYFEGGISISHRIADPVRLSLGYARADRDDRFVGYDDYVRDMVWAEMHLRVGSRLVIEVRAENRDYSYPQAYAFDRPAGGPLDLEMVRAALSADFRLTDTLFVYADAELEDVSSSDPRLAVDRRIGSVGLRWSP